MKIWKSMLAMMLCSGMIIAFGLSGCGSDDNVEPGMTCGEALTQFKSEACQTAAFANVEAAKTCAVACPEGDENCLDDCLSAFEDDISACMPGTQMIFNTCNACWSGCGDTFVTCLLGASTGTQCMNAVVTCVDACP
jgi:hypothetical protein